MKTAGEHDCRLVCEAQPFVGSSLLPLWTFILYIDIAGTPLFAEMNVDTTASLSLIMEPFRFAVSS